MVSSFVANDISLEGGPGDSDDLEQSQEALEQNSFLKPQAASMLVLSGSNFSGKSIFMKQTALIVYMAHVGSFVPASSATIGITDKILTRVSTQESVSKTQSAFMIDLQQIAFAVQMTTHRSLLIVDEFGKGTDSSGEHYFLQGSDAVHG